MPYGRGCAKGVQVEHMFDRIAPSYDEINRRMSWGTDRRWRRRAIRRLMPYHPQTVLDIATGTGDFAIEAARTLRPARLTCTDISEGMMAIGRRKVREAGLDDRITFRREDCLNMSFADGSFDAVTVAFGIRNLQDLDRGLSEICRVLKKGGRLSVVELNRPTTFPVRQLFYLYTHTLLPLYGRLWAHDGKAYRYLTASIEAFPSREVMTAALRRAGFGEITVQRMTLGICTCYLATK